MQRLSAFEERMECDSSRASLDHRCDCHAGQGDMAREWRVRAAPMRFLSWWGCSLGFESFAASHLQQPMLSTSAQRGSMKERGCRSCGSFEKEGSKRASTFRT